MGTRLSQMTARDLERMGVELHLGAMVTDVDAQGVELTQADGQHLRIEASTKVWAAGTRASPLGAKLASATRGEAWIAADGSRFEPDCSVPGYPEIFVVGDLMALDDLPGVAEVAMQSGAHAAHTIERRLRGDTDNETVPLPRPGNAGGDLPIPGRGQEWDHCRSAGSSDGCCGSSST